MGGQQQRLFGVDPAQMDIFLGHRKLLVRQAVRPRRGASPTTFAREPHRPPAMSSTTRSTRRFLASGLELVIDERLQSVGGYELGDEIPIMGQNFRIVGVVQAGVAGRVFAPLQTLREIVLAGRAQRQHVFREAARRSRPGRRGHGD
jgi:hypothetical protein